MYGKSGKAGIAISSPRHTPEVNAIRVHKCPLLLAGAPAACYSRVMQQPLSVSHLSYWFSKDRPVLEDVSFSLEAGEITLLAGTNGAGKSVLLKTVKGLLKPRAGTILIAGKDCTKDRNARLRSVGLVFQDAGAQIVGRTVEKDIRFGMENLTLEREEQEKRLASVARLLHLEGKLHDDPYTLSGGEQRRLAIAGVLVMDPSILLMDEPFAGLDWPSVKQVLSSLLALKERGTPIMIVSHEAEKILAHASRVIVMDRGRIVGNGKPQEMIPVMRRTGIHISPRLAVEDMTWLDS